MPKHEIEIGERLAHASERWAQAAVYIAGIIGIGLCILLIGGGCVAPGAATFTVLDAQGINALADRLLPPVEANTVPAWVAPLGGALATGGWVIWDRRRFHKRNGSK